MGVVCHHVEWAAKTGFSAALTTAGITTVNWRCFWLNDESGEGQEDRECPAIVLATNPSTNLGRNVAGTLNNRVHTVTQGLVIATHVVDDPKRATLLAIYTAIRGAVDGRNFTTDFTTIGSNLAWQSLGVEAGSVGVGGDSDNEQYVTLELTWVVCGTP